jgi:hypothetical protein
MVEVKVRLNIRSKEELKGLEQDVVQLEQLTRREKQATGSARKSKRDFLTEEALEMGLFGGAGRTALPSSIMKKRRKAAIDRATDAKMGSAGKAISSGELAQGVAPYQRGNAFKDLQKQVSINTKAMGAMQRGLGGFMQFGALSRAGSSGLLGLATGAASKILPVGIAIAVATQVFQIWKDSYGAGGVNDVRKLILDDVTSFIGTERETAILSGNQFFANTRTLKQGQWIQTNTEDLRDGFARTKLLRSKYGR